MGFKCVKERSKLIFTRDSDKRTAIFDLADQSCYNFQGRKVKSLNSYFANYFISDVRFEDKVYEKFVRTVLYGNSRLRNVGTALNLLYDYRHNEGYLLLGLQVSGRMRQPISDYPKPVRKFLVAKFVNDTQFSRRYNYTLHNWLSFFREASTEKIRFIQLIKQLELEDIIDINEHCLIHAIINMVQTYNMDRKSLLLQIGEYIRREGLTFSTTVTNLNDYNSMSSEMTTQWHKYPKYLLSTHQIAVKNYNTYKVEYEEEAFKRAVNKDLAHKGVSYSVLIPTCSQDIKDEGANQQHCVASYVSSTLNGNTQIVFMRSNKKLDKALVTLEIKNEQVYQAKGHYNRAVTPDELKFIQTYAKAKELGVSKNL